MAAAKIHAPSATRVAEARRAGLGPRLSVAGFAAAWVALAAYSRISGSALWRALAGLLRRPLEALAQGNAARARELAFTALGEIAAQLALLLALVVVCVALVLWLAQGPHFGLPTRPRRHFDRPARSFIAAVLAGLVVCALFAALLSPALWLEPAGLAGLLSHFLAYVALALALVAVIDVASARTVFLRALWMTRQELKEETREAYGSPELRSARERVRRESGRGAASEARP
jgi:flagellar biosynthesis protein FlhB